MAEYRFRAEGELLVLQVFERKTNRYYTDELGTWRDAKVEDVPVGRIFGDTSERIHNCERVTQGWQGQEQ